MIFILRVEEALAMEEVLWWSRLSQWRSGGGAGSTLGRGAERNVDSPLSRGVQKKLAHSEMKKLLHIT